MTQSQTEPGWYSEEAATFGDRVAAARDMVGVTQSDLAHHLGVKEKTIRAWENDLAEPRANKLSMLAGVLNVSMRWLLTGVGNDVSGPDETEPLSSDLANLLAEMREMRGQAVALGERIARLEKRLRTALRDQQQ